MDPGFFSDPDPDFRKPLGSKWCFWLGFGGTWPKSTVLVMQNMKEKVFLLYSTVKDFFFMDPHPDFSG